MWYLACGLVGALVGIGELVARYRDDPVRAVLTVPAVFYVLVNFGASILALWLLREVWTLDGLPAYSAAEGLDPATRSDEFSPARATKEVLLAGLGALAFIRASIMKIKVGDSDMALGPSFVLDVLLAAADRAVDRKMAAPRADVVREIMGEVAFEQAKETLPAHCFRLMQNISAEEEQQFALEVEALASSGMSEKVKALNLGLALLNIVGETVLRTAVNNLKQEFTASSAFMDKVRSALADVPYGEAKKTLPPLCLALTSTTEERKDALVFGLAAIDDSELDEWAKTHLLGLILIKSVGEEVFEKAADALKRGLRASVAPARADEPIEPPAAEGEDAPTLDDHQTGAEP